MKQIYSRCCNFMLSLADRCVMVTAWLVLVLQSGCSGGEPAIALAQETNVTQNNQVAQLSPALPTDWPQIRGLGGAGVAVGQTIEPWGDRGPRKVWSVNVGAGFSSPIVFGKFVFMVHRAGRGNDPMTADLRFADTGEIIWRQDLPCGFGNGEMDNDPGPKATPAYDQGKIFVYGPAGVMFCLDATNGDTIWKRNLAEQYGSNKGYFGVGTSPIVVGENVIVNAGGRNASVVALNKNTGEESWTVLDDRASYSSPVELTFEGKQAVVVVTRLHVVGIEAVSGKLAFKMRFGKTGPTAVGAMPVLVGDNVFLNAAYNVGGRTLALAGQENTFGDQGYQAETLWSDGDVFASQYSTPVLHNGLLYGTSGREDVGNGSFRCFDPLTGELKWQQPNIVVGHTLLVGDRLLFVDHKSNLRLLDASPAGYKKLCEVKLYGSPSKTIPAISNGRLFTRCDGINATLDCWKLQE